MRMTFTLCLNLAVLVARRRKKQKEKEQAEDDQRNIFDRTPSPDESNSGRNTAATARNVDLRLDDNVDEEQCDWQ